MLFWHYYFFCFILLRSTILNILYFQERVVKLSDGFIKKLKKEKFRKGFTLIEVLIVIAIIGVLTAGMTLAAGGSRDAAEATRIIADLRTIKTAALMWVADDPEGVDSSKWTGDENNSLDKYLDRPVTSYDNYKFETIMLNDREVWLLGYDLSGVRDGVVKRLAEQADSAGLFLNEKDETTNSLKKFTVPGEDSVKDVYVIVQ